MISDSNSLVKILVTILFFPTFFQEAFLQFAWGANDPLWMMLAKRLLILLPVGAVILSCWLSIACGLTVLVRQNRQRFITLLFITWWDLGKSFAAFWGGLVRFLFYFAAAALGMLKIAVMGILTILHDIILMPFRVLRSLSKNLVNSSIPWVAVILTLVWCLMEALLFTYVTTPLVLDTFANITGEQLGTAMLRVPLFLFMLFIILGSYAVLANFLEVIRSKNFMSIVAIVIIELVVLMVEVMFLYREFVDALVPWFAQYSDRFELGLFSTLAIAVLSWFGIRSLSWFLFAAHGTPALLAFIQGRGAALLSADKQVPVIGSPQYLELFSAFLQRIRSDISWVEDRGEALVSALMLPPLQIVAATLNFCTLLVNGRHLFGLPFKGIGDILSTQKLMEDITAKQKSLSDA